MPNFRRFVRHLVDRQLGSDLLSQVKWSIGWTQKCVHRISQLGLPRKNWRN
jgi:hypothetical protein